MNSNGLEDKRREKMKWDSFHVIKAHEILFIIDRKQAITLNLNPSIQALTYRCRIDRNVRQLIANRKQFEKLRLYACLNKC